MSVVQLFSRFHCRVGIAVIAIVGFSVFRCVAEEGKTTTLTDAVTIKVADKVGTKVEATPETLEKKIQFPVNRASDGVDRVTVKCNFAGVVRGTVKGSTKEEKFHAVSEVSYLEKMLTGYSRDKQVRALRFYDRVEATDKFDEDQQGLSVRKDRRLIVADMDGSTLTHFSPKGPLTRNELDLIETHCDGLVADRLLPNEPLTIGATYKLPESVVACLTNLEQIAHTDMHCTFTQADEKKARFEMNGRVQGAANGVAAEIEIQAKFRYDRESERVDWIGLLLRESRPISPVTDGFKITSQVQVLITPDQEACSELQTAALDEKSLETAPENVLLTHQSPRYGWEIIHDRDWALYRDKNDVAEFRRMVKGNLLAHCNFSTHFKRDPKKLVSLDDFQKEAQKSLKENFEKLVEAGESTDQQGRRILRVKVQGLVKAKAEELMNSRAEKAKVADDDKKDEKKDGKDAKSEADPIELPMYWIFYHVSDQEGRQASFTFSVEESLLEKFGDADKRLIAGLVLSDPEMKAEKKTAGK